METYTNIYQQRPSLISGTSIEVATRAASVAPCGARAWRRRCSGGRRGRGGGRGLVVVTLGSSERPRKGGKLGEILEMHPPT